MLHVPWTCILCNRADFRGPKGESDRLARQLKRHDGFIVNCSARWLRHVDGASDAAVTEEILNSGCARRARLLIARGNSVERIEIRTLDDYTLLRSL